MVRVAFIHPDLGIGGAERLVVDAALALKSRGHSVRLFTAHHDPGHCFRETADGTLEITCRGDWLPRHCCYRGHAVFAYLRMIYLAFYLVFFSKAEFDLIFCDQISACVPVLKWSGAKVLFYCHFPDQLLTARRSWLKRLYRWPIDWLEETTTGQADEVLVNSNFTAQVFCATFRSLVHIQPSILYPSLNFAAFDRESVAELDSVVPPQAKTIFLSINRYERKKNLPLAIIAFSRLLRRLGEEERGTVHLVMAGGYDERVAENREHYLELRKLAKDLGADDNVTFLCSFSDSEKVSLLTSCTALIYTPSNEHFGICPLEAMYMERPVIAVNSGGPLETVIDGKTGFLCEPTPDAFAVKMAHFVRTTGARGEMGKAGKRRVIGSFSFAAFTRKLNRIVTRLANSNKQQ